MKRSESDPALLRAVWRSLPHSELERQYNARDTVPDLPFLLQQYRESSKLAYAQCRHVADVAYGDHPDQTLDIFPVPGRPDAPLMVFVHGGYWRALGKEDSVFMAVNLSRLGVATAAINYTLSPKATLGEIVAQCRQALVWLARHASQHGVSGYAMVLAGSSAGAHLVAMMMSETWQREESLPEQTVAGAVLVSGLYDLEPVQQTLPNSWLQLDALQADQLSPIHDPPAAGQKICIVTAAGDTLEFKRQSALYAGYCQGAGCRVVSHEIADRNHFNVILDWMEPHSVLTRATLALLQSG